MMLVLQQERRIEKIAFTTRGPVKIHGEVEGRFTVKSIEESLEREVDGSRLTYETYFAAFSTLLGQLENLPHVARVYYLLENPELDFLPKEVIPRPFDFFTISTNRNYVDRELYLLRMAKYREGVNALRFPKLVVLDPIDVLCDDMKCSSFINGNFVYADDDHFSVFGSQLVSQYFEGDIFAERQAGRSR